MKHKTITSKDFRMVFWLNDNQDFCCSPIDGEPRLDYVSSLIASSNSTCDIEKLLEIHQHLVIVQMGGFSTMLDSYRKRKAKA